MADIDPSGWKSYSGPDGTIRAEVIVTKRVLRAMSLRQKQDLEAGSYLLARAFEPDQPIAYVHD